MTEHKRLKTKLDNVENVLEYYTNRSIQLLPMGWSWDGAYSQYDWGVAVPFVLKSERYYSVYVYPNFRGKGNFKLWFANNPEIKMWTMTECNLAPKFEEYKIPYILANIETNEIYRQINAVRRDDLDGKHFFMNNLDKTLFVTRTLNSKPSIENYLFDDILEKKPNSLFDLLKFDCNNSGYSNALNIVKLHIEGVTDYFDCNTRAKEIAQLINDKTGGLSAVYKTK